MIGGRYLLQLIKVILLCSSKLTDEISLNRFNFSFFCIFQIENDSTNDAFSELLELIRCKDIVAKLYHVLEDVDGEQNEAEVATGQAEL